MNTSRALNYRRQDEIPELNRIAVMFLDYAEDQAKRRKQVLLAHWKAKLDAFLKFNDRRVLPDAGSISREAANEKAELEFKRFGERRRARAEEQAEGDSMRELEAQVRELPKPRESERRSSPSPRV